MIIENPQKSKKYCRRPPRWIRDYCIRCPCILIWNHKPMPLKKVKYEVAINGGMANVTLSQEYFNNTATPINVSYQFPVNESVVFGGMEAIFKNRRVQGKIKEKQQAKAEFNMHKALGNTVAYAEQLEETEDIMKVELGNFPPGQPLTISFRYLVTLDVINEVNWAFRIPATLTPRYNPGTVTDQGYVFGNPRWKTCKMFNDARYTVTEKYPWEINVNIAWPGGAKKVASLSHNGQVIISQQPGMINIRMNPACGLQYPNKDFELMIEDQNLFSNNCQVAMTNMPTLTGGSPKYAAMMQFVPSMYKWYADKGIDDEKGIDLYPEENEDFLIETTYAEYIFILDRSGSMSGSRMNKAKTALIFFLKSLPINSRFNVVSFGSSFSMMFPMSVEYNTMNLNNAVNQINHFSADMGGTEILQPIQSAFSCQRVPNYQRNIFLLTDGAVSNTTQIFNAIEVNCVYNAARVFSIGIGNGCSELLVKRSARVGKGKSVIIADNENVQGKIISLLNESLTPSLTNFSVDFDPKYICAIGPQPNASSHILRGEPFTMYALIKNDIEKAPDMTTQVKVKFYDSVEKKIEERVFNLSLNGCIQDNSYHKMAVKKVIENNENKVIKTAYLDPKLASVPGIYTKLAVAYQVLSAKHTAFICVIEENNNGVFSPTQDVIVPTLESIDYSGQDAPTIPGIAHSMRFKSSFGGSRGRGGRQRATNSKRKKKMRSNQMQKLNNFSQPMACSAPMQSMDKLGSFGLSSNNMMGGGAPVPQSANFISLNSSSSVNDTFGRMKQQESISKPSRARKREAEKVERFYDTRNDNLESDSDDDEAEDMELEIGSIPLQKPKNKTDQVNNIVLQQDVQGFWNLNENLLHSLFPNQAQIEPIKTQIGSNPQAYMTLLLVAWLQKNADENSVEMILKKAMRFLRKQNIANYKELIEQAKACC